MSFASAVSLSALSPCQNVNSTGSDGLVECVDRAPASSSNGIVVVRRWREGRRRLVPSSSGARVSPGASVSPGGNVAGASTGKVVAGSLPALRIVSPFPQAADEHAGRDERVSAALHPFTAPAVRPRTSWRWNRAASIATGMAAITVPAITRFGSSSAEDRSRRSPLCTVFMSASVVIRFGHRYWFQAPRKLNSAERAERRSHEWDADVTEESEMSDAVDGGGVTQVGG